MPIPLVVTSTSGNFKLTWYYNLNYYYTVFLVVVVCRANTRSEAASGFRQAPLALALAHEFKLTWLKLPVELHSSEPDSAPLEQIVIPLAPQLELLLVALLLVVLPLYNKRAVLVGKLVLLLLPVQLLVVPVQPSTSSCVILDGLGPVIESPDA